ncbi:hypothetical protein SCARD494_10149 [Seiridium cardinale]
MMPWSSQTGRVMKKPDEYSKNPNTVRARARKARLDPYTREVEQANASDSKAVTRAWNLRLQSEAYQNATPSARKIMLEQVEEDVMARRRKKGYDAESKIARFLHASNASLLGASSIIDPAAPAMNGYDGSMTPGPQGFMQPMASMHATPFPGQVGTDFATPRLYPGQIMFSVEGHRALTEASFSQQPQIQVGTPRSSINSPLGLYPYGSGSQQNEIDPTFNASSKAQLETKIKNQQDRIEKLEKAILGVFDDLVLAKSTIRSQEVRMNQLEERMHIYYNTASGLDGAEAEFARQTSKLRQVVFGVQRITDVAAEVYSSFTNGRPDNLGANGVVSNIIPDLHAAIANVNAVSHINGISIDNSDALKSKDDELDYASMTGPEDTGASPEIKGSPASN